MQTKNFPYQLKPVLKETILSAEKLNISYSARQENPTVRDMDFEVCKGEIMSERMFEKIGEKLSNHSRERLKNYSFAMSGIDQSVKIENWIAEKDLTNVFHTEEELLDLILSFFKEITLIKKCPNFA